jgi:hypothetical protein
VITGLDPDTQYYYSIGPISGSIEAGNDSNHYFTTAPAVGSNRKVRIWAIGDPGTGTSDQQNVRNAFYNLDNVKTDVVLALGDNAYNSGTDSEYTNNFFNVYNDLLRHAPVWATRGNHEGNLSVHQTAFTHPANAESGGMASGSELYYSFDYGNIHFVCLDSFTSSNLNGDAMYTWLESDLASTTQNWIIAFWHHPPYSRSSSHDSDSESGQRVTRERANPILEKYGVDLQLGGHNHFYSRTVLINNHYGLSNTYSQANHAVDAGDGRENGDGVYYKATNPEGAVYVLAGSSGKMGYTPIHHPANFTEVVVLGSMVIDVEGDRMDVRMLRENGAIQDYFTITKSASVNQAPQVNAGANQSTDTVSTITLDATVTDDGLPSNTLTYSWSKVSGPGNVSFGNASLVDTTASFSEVGSYVLQLVASDGALSGDDSLSVTVSAANQPPQVNAGPDQSAVSGTTIDLDATVSDDGLPSNTLTYSWSKVSGPGNVSFGNASMVDTTASFSEVGSYVLQLVASDGELSDNDSLSVTISAANQAPQVNAGADQSTDTASTINLDATVSDDGLPSNTLTYSWSKVSGPGNVSFGNASLVDTTASFSAAGSYVLRLVASDGELSDNDSLRVAVSAANQAPQVNAGADQSTNTASPINLDATVSDDGLPSNTLTYSWSKVSGPGNVSFGNASLVDTTASFSAAGSYVLRLVASDGALSGSDSISIAVSLAGIPNQAPQVNAGANQSTDTASTINLDATVIDDGLPSNTLTYSWSKVSGPGNVSFGNASLVDTTASFSAAGSYVLRLVASDGALSDNDTLMVTVSAANQAPQVNAGPDQTAVIGTTIDLNATVSDDGLPSNNLTYSWSKVSGPGNVTFSDASLVDTSATILTAGSYVLQLEASDGALATSDQVTITIDEEGGGGSGGSASSMDLGFLIGFLGLILFRAAPGLASRKK